MWGGPDEARVRNHGTMARRRAGTTFLVGGLVAIFVIAVLAIFGRMLWMEMHDFVDRILDLPLPWRDADVD